MTDIKKVAITSVSSHKGEKKEGKKKRTIRLILTLPESNEKSCPEFNYGDLLSQHLYHRLGKDRLGDVINGPQKEKGDQYASDEDEALKALARQFEKKYGGGVAGGPKRRKRKKENDFKQLGEGYDETDPFIDNSDAVDDVLPTNVETKLGGFYINSGELNFEEVQISEDEGSNDSDVQGVKRKRKTEISSSEEEKENEGEEEKDAINTRENGILKVKKRKLDEGEMLRRRKKMIDKFNARKQKQKEETSENETEVKPTENQDEAKTSNGISIAASIEAVVNKAREGSMLERNPEGSMEEREEDEEEEREEEEEEEEGEKEEEKDESSSSESSSSSSSSESSSSDSDSEDDKEDKESEKDESEKREEESEEIAVSNDNDDNDHDHPNASDNEKDNALPSDLPPDLIAALDRLKEVGKNSKASSQKFFTEPVNKMLLSVEIKLCKCGGRKKNLIYNHLAQHLPCGTQTLIKRGKNLLAEKLDERLKMPLKTLKEILEKMMPPLIEAHALECQKIAEKNPQQYWELYYHFWGEGPQQPEEELLHTSVEPNKKVKLPKKKFEFTAELRALLCDIVRIRCQGWHMIKKRSETAEEHVKSFIDSHLKNLWPKGWVTTKFLYKESQYAHTFITSRIWMKPSVAKKVTVLGGGTVSNANISPSLKLTQKETPTVSIPPKTMDDFEKPKPLSTDTEKIASSTSLVDSKPTQEIDSKTSTSSAQGKSAPDVKESKAKENNVDITSSSSNKRPGEKESNSTLIKTIAAQFIKVNLPKPTSSSPPKDSTKVLSDFQLLSSVSPVSESSPKSFHGFESPSKPHDGHKGNDGTSAKQSLVFDSMKKQSKSNSENCDSLPPVREGKPPKPSLTATALPKITIASTVSISKADAMKRVHTDYSEQQKAAKDDRRTITCITIKSVEKINEAVSGTPSKNEKEKDKTVATESPPKDKRIPSTEILKSNKSVRVIDLLCDESGQYKNKSSNSQRKESVGLISSSISVQNLTPESNKNQNISSNIPSVTQGSDTFSKNNKLEQEMDQVMNELLQISKKNLKSSGGDESANKQGSSSGSVVEPNKSPQPSKSLDKEISLNVNPSQHQKRPNSQSLSQAGIRTSPVSLNTYDVSKPSVQVQPPKISPFSPDNSDLKIQSIHHYQKQNSSQSHKTSDLSSLQQSSHSSNTHYGSAHHSVHLGSSASSHGLSYGGNQNSAQQSSVCTKISQNSSGHNTYQSSQSSSSSRNAPSHDSSYSKAHSVPSSTTSGNRGMSSAHSGTHRSSPATQNSTHSAAGTTQTSSHSLTAFSGNSRPSPSTHGGSHKPSPSTHGGSHKPSPSTHGGSHKPSPSTHGGSNKQSPSTHGVSHKPSPSTHGVSHKPSPSTHSGNHRTSSSHSGSHRTSSANTSAQALSTSHRSSSQSGSQRISTSSHSGNHGSSSSSHGGPQSSSNQSGSHGSVLTGDNGSPQLRGYGAASNSGQRSSQSGLVALARGSTPSAAHSSTPSAAHSSTPSAAHSSTPSAAHSSTPSAAHSSTPSAAHSSIPSAAHSSSSSKSSLNPSLKSSNPMHSVPPRSSKPSHNIEGLLYNSSSSTTKNSSPINLTQSNYIHSQHSSHPTQSHHQPSTAQRTQPKFSQSNSGPWTQEPSSLSIRSSSGSSKTASGSLKSSSTSSKHKLIDNSYSVTGGNTGDPLANLRLMEGLSVSNVPKKSPSLAVYSNSSNSGSSRTLVSPSSHRPSTSVQPKAKQSDSFSLSMSPHPLLGNLTAEQQQELWQQMNTGGYLPGISPGDVYKYISQQGLYQDANSTGNSSKKSSQY